MASIPRKVALNSNILLSALIGNGKPRQLILMLAYHDIDLLIPKYVFDEVEEKLNSKDYFLKNRYKLELEVLSIAKQVCTVIPTRNGFSKTKITVRDPKDVPVIEACLNSSVEILVTGDPDLLILKKIAGLKIVTADSLFTLIQREIDS